MRSVQHLRLSQRGLWRQERSHTFLTINKPRFFPCRYFDV